MLRRLWLRLLWFLFQKRIIRVMGYNPPQNIPVPMVTVEPLNLRIGIWATLTVINTTLVGVFVKEDGAVDYTAVANVNINKNDAAMKTYIEGNFDGNERRFLQVEIFDKLNTGLDNYLRSTFDWEKDLAGSELRPNDDQINAMASQTDQINWFLANYGSIQVDAEKKTINVYA